MFLRGGIHIKICQTSHATSELDVNFINCMKIVEILVNITQNTCGNVSALIWAVMESGCALVEAFGTAPKQNLTKSSFFEVSTQNLKLLKF